MGFADAYLQKHAIRGPLVSEIPDPQLNTIIAIPAYNESGLTTCLDSLFQCDPPVAPAEVIVLINTSESSSREVVATNRQSYEEVREWIRLHRIPRYRMERSEAASLQQENKQNSNRQENTNRDQVTSQQRENTQVSGQQDSANRNQTASQQRKNIQSSGQQDNANTDPATSRPQEKLRFHVVLVEDLPDKHFGAGLARKLVMDEAVRRLASRAVKSKVSGIIVSLDADTVVRRDYLQAVEDHFSRHPQTSGCAISFEHPLSMQEYTHLFSKPVSQPPNTSDTSSPPHSRSENLSPKNLTKENLPRESQPSPTPENLPPSNLSPASQPNENPTPESLSPKNRNLQNPPPEQFPPEVFDAVTNYELHQRYYLLAVRYTGYPYAFHTVGSCFAVQVEAYCRAGGMSRRQAGEDFYFIQKLAMQGGFTECRSTRVYPSPRPSDRVPFGTGPDISRQIDDGLHGASAKHFNDRDSDGTCRESHLSVHATCSDAFTGQSADRHRDGAFQGCSQLLPYQTYNPELVEHLREFFALIPRFYRSDHANVLPGTGSENDPAVASDHEPATGIKRAAPEENAMAAGDSDPPVGTEKAALPVSVPPLLGRYLEESGFWQELEEIHGNTASEEAFRKRFFNKFNMFRILKYLHFAEEHGVKKMEVTAAARVMLEMWGEVQGGGKGLPRWEKIFPDCAASTVDNHNSTLTREMLLLYRKYFG